MYIRIKVITSAKHELVKKIKEDLYNISVKEPALMNLANKRICQIMAVELGINSKAVRIISGHQSPSKIISVNI